MRERTAHAVMRLLGGRKLAVEEVGEEISDLLDNGDAPSAELFDRRERVMISGVLQLAERPIRGLMTVRADVDTIDLADDREAIRTRLMHSSYSRLPLIRNGAVDEPLGFVHKKELLKEYLAGTEPNLSTWRARPSTCSTVIRSSTHWSRCARPRRTLPLWSTNSVILSVC